MFPAGMGVHCVYARDKAGRESTETVLFEQGGALGVGVCVYTGWRSLPAAELRCWVCSEAVLVSSVAGTWMCELLVPQPPPQVLSSVKTCRCSQAHRWPSETHYNPLLPATSALHLGLW